MDGAGSAAGSAAVAALLSFSNLNVSPHSRVRWTAKRTMNCCAQGGQRPP
eukprot:CAMPEP_0180791614 /NCGR_PEP_ID=MMETSP1038_2-20121128/53917_1 /TAXON_ID=632150 /ORGANISM="Azadinium spinosum, Strain 3D9" /LENGTH=49 /DNA_ID= /DNA_START= /DNA_END= /DNA_ORIENTATION=